VGIGGVVDMSNSNVYTESATTVDGWPEPDAEEQRSAREADGRADSMRAVEALMKRELAQQLLRALLAAKRVARRRVNLEYQPPRVFFQSLNLLELSMSRVDFVNMHPGVCRLVAREERDEYGRVEIRLAYEVPTELLPYDEHVRDLVTVRPFLSGVTMSKARRAAEAVVEDWCKSYHTSSEFVLSTSDAGSSDRGSVDMSAEGHGMTEQQQQQWREGVTSATTAGDTIKEKSSYSVASDRADYAITTPYRAALGNVPRSSKDTKSKLSEPEAQFVKCEASL
jgi:hypothetical protein